MSELNNRDRNAYSKFEHMSTEDLETILRLDYQLPEGEGLDPDTILAITEVIANREKSESTPQYPDTDTAWNDFLTKYRPHGGQEILRLFSAGAVCAGSHAPLWSQQLLPHSYSPLQSPLQPLVTIYGTSSPNGQKKPLLSPQMAKQTVPHPMYIRPALPPT